MKKQKTYKDVLGWQKNCSWYEMCPICYGCRAYDSKYVRCQRCAENMKFNVCDTKKHRSDLVAMMVTRNVVDLNK